MWKLNELASLMNNLSEAIAYFPHPQGTPNEVVCRRVCDAGNRAMDLYEMASGGIRPKEDAHHA
jgi:hypothetical protein